MAEITQAAYPEKDCPSCQRLRQNCCLSPLTFTPLPFSGKQFARCPYYWCKLKPLRNQLALW